MRDGDRGGSAFARGAGGERVRVRMADRGRVEVCCNNRTYAGQGQMDSRVPIPQLACMGAERAQHGPALPCWARGRDQEDSHLLCTFAPGLQYRVYDTLFQ